MYKSGLLRPFGIKGPLENAIGYLPGKSAQITLAHGILHRIVLITEIHSLFPAGSRDP